MPTNKKGPDSSRVRPLSCFPIPTIARRKGQSAYLAKLLNFGHHLFFDLVGLLGQTL